MRVAMIGSGYVGLVSGACFAELGHTVTCVDKDAGKIEALRNGRMPIYEPGLAELVARSVAERRLSFTTGLPGAAEGAEAVFIAVGTPSRPADGLADLTYVYQAAREIARALSGYAVVVTKSTVPVGTGDEIQRIIADIQPGADPAHGPPRRRAHQVRCQRLPGHQDYLHQRDRRSVREGRSRCPGCRQGDRARRPHRA